MSTNYDFSLMPDMATFVLVVETGSFSNAARQLDATPSAASRSIARLERAMNARLLHRTTRKLSLTDAGKTAYRHCRDMLDSARSALNVSGSQDEAPAGRLRICTPRALGRFLIHPHIPAFLAVYPHVDIELMLDDHDHDLFEGQIDLAFRVTGEPPPSLMGRRLFRIEHLICATPAYLERRGRPASPKDLKSHSCIALSSASQDSRWKFSKDGKTVSVDVHGRYTVNHTGVRLDAVFNDIGIGSMPLFTARKALADGLIEQVLPDWSFKTNYHGDVWLLYPPTRNLAPKVRHFIDFIAKRLQVSLQDIAA